MIPPAPPHRTPAVGLTAVGGMVLAGGGLLPGSVAQGLAGVAVAVSAINIGGGFTITQVRELINSGTVSCTVSNPNRVGVRVARTLVCSALVASLPGPILMQRCLPIPIPTHPNACPPPHPAPRSACSTSSSAHRPCNKSLS